MKKKRRTKRASYWGMAASTTSKDWGNAVAGKGGKTTNYNIPDSMYQREQREQNKQ